MSERERMTMESIEKLRELVEQSRREYTQGNVSYNVELNEIADEIERELSERYMELPLDADGVPIRVGDVMIDLKTPREVVAVTEEHVMLGGYPMTGEQRYRFAYASSYRHRKPTVEDVLQEVVAAYMDTPLGDLNETKAEFFEKYADKLREAVRDE